MASKKTQPKTVKRSDSLLAARIPAPVIVAQRVLGCAKVTVTDHRGQQRDQCSVHRSVQWPCTAALRTAEVVRADREAIIKAQDVTRRIDVLLTKAARSASTGAVSMAAQQNAAALRLAVEQIAALEATRDDVIQALLDLGADPAKVATMARTVSADQRTVKSAPRPVRAAS